MREFDRGIFTLFVIWGALILFGYRKKRVLSPAEANRQSPAPAPPENLSMPAAA